jgi:1,4-alpha-glucan branching enzyme
VYKNFGDVQTIAEEASDWAGITKPINKDGFGFGMKWMMGWMHDSFDYFKKNWAGRAAEQNDFTFSMMYYYDEKFMLPLSHDEVVHGKSPMIYKMPGYEYEKFANLRLYYSCMYTHPGAKLMFMGNEFAQTNEWDYNSELQWELLGYEAHNGMQECLRKLNHLYQQEPAMHELQFDKKGFVWENIENPEKGIIAYRRSGKDKSQDLLVIINNSNENQTDWEIVVQGKEQWQEIFNSDDKAYWGSGNYSNTNPLCTNVDKKKKTYKIKISISAFSCVIFK